MKKVVLVLSVFLVSLVLLLSATFIQRGAEANSGYVGVDTCKGCHENKYDSYVTSVHSKKAIPGSPANREGCESCHGEGSAHVEKGGGRGTGIFSFDKKIDPKERSAKCLACHESTKHLAFWNAGTHQAEGVACDNCHAVHAGGDKLLKADKSEVCYQCHSDIRSLINKQSHHPVKEGKVACVDCHNPHGSMNNKMLQAESVNDLCYKCHPEKRGPYMQEHPPVEENCLTCHNPHGSNHNRLLTERVPELCQNCHNGTGFHAGGVPVTSFSNPANGRNATNAAFLMGRSCLNCHNNIHGQIGVSGSNAAVFIH